jgi:hypothetical protein
MARFWASVRYLCLVFLPLTQWPPHVELDTKVTVQDEERAPLVSFWYGVSSQYPVKWSRLGDVGRDLFATTSIGTVIEWDYGEIISNWTMAARPYYFDLHRRCPSHPQVARSSTHIMLPSCSTAPKQTSCRVPKQYANLLQPLLNSLWYQIQAIVVLHST